MLWLLLLSSSASAASLCDVLGATTGAVRAFLPDVTSREAAECVRIARVEDGRDVTLLTDAFRARGRGSFVSGLALAGVRVREANLRASGVVLIGARAWRVHNGTLTGASNTSELSRWFDGAAKVARPLSPVEAAERLRRLP